MTDVLRRLRRSPQGIIGSTIMLFLLFICLFGPYLAPFDPEAMSLTGRFSPPGGEYLLGSDQFGRDILSRLLTGGRSTLLAAIAATLLGTFLGAAIGNTAAYLGGRWDEIIMRTMDALKAMPSLLLALLIVSTLGTGTVNTVLAIAVAFTPGMARITRSVGLSLRRQDFVNAAIARGEGALWIVFREMLPNAISPIVVEATIRVAFAIMTFATLSFLGLGVQPPASDWGLMAADARSFMHQAPWVILMPCMAIAITAIGFNLFGDGLRDALNPRGER